jgi:hypothetical protein
MLPAREPRRAVEAKTLELRAATSLSHLWQQQGKRATEGQGWTGAYYNGCIH